MWWCTWYQLEMNRMQWHTAFCSPEPIRGPSDNAVASPRKYSLGPSNVFWEWVSSALEGELHSLAAWCVTENACTALHKPPTVATSDLFTSFPSFQAIYACFFFTPYVSSFSKNSVIQTISSLQLCKLRPNSVLGFIKPSVVNSGQFLMSSMTWCFSVKLLLLKRAAHVTMWVFIF